MTTKTKATKKKTTMTITPTAEQAAVVELARTGNDISVVALAGSGKTTTLRFAAGALPGKGQYVAFNTAIVNVARKGFPANVNCRTAHGLAFQAVGARYKDRLFGARMTRRDIARWLGCRPYVAMTRYGNRQIDAPVVAGLAIQTVSRFCHLGDREITANHVPWVALISETADGREELAAAILPLANRIWNDLRSTDGQLPFSHDNYLKLWQLSNPVIPCDYLLFDEAQDADPVMLTVVNAQTCQLIYCGDRYQAIYEWRGAVNALERVHVDHTAWLTQSFRFGQAIANEANDLLGRLSAERLLVGSPTINSQIQRIAAPDAILCRTNGGVMANVMTCLAERRKPAVAGGTKTLIDFAEACGVLIDGGRTGHPDLAPFESWDDVLGWVRDESADAAEIGSMVRLVDSYGVAQLVNALNGCVTEKKCNVFVSTAHKAKGREWGSVRIAGDFLHRDDMDTEDLRLAYVAVTRARQSLDISQWLLVPRLNESPAVPPGAGPALSIQRPPRRQRPPIV